MAKNYLKFVIPVAPKSQKETQFGRGFAYTPKEKKEYMLEIVKLCKNYKGSFEDGCYLEVTWKFYFPSLKSSPLSTTLKNKKPDTDNLVKVVKDALSSSVIFGSKRKKTAKYGAGVIGNDSNVCIEHTYKYTIGKAETTKIPRIVVIIHRITPHGKRFSDRGK